jgi:hypothetical protein
MQVFVVYDDPSVRVAGDHDPLALDLVAHFVGMVVPDNINSRPSPCRVRGSTAPKLRGGGHVLAFPEARRAADVALEREAYIEAAYRRAVDSQVRALRFSDSQKSHVSRLFEETCGHKIIS